MEQRHVSETDHWWGAFVTVVAVDGKLLLRMSARDVATPVVVLCCAKAPGLIVAATVGS
jgi:hypothetical protein